MTEPNNPITGEMGNYNLNCNYMPCNLSFPTTNCQMDGDACENIHKLINKYGSVAGLKILDQVIEKYEAPYDIPTMIEIAIDNFDDKTDQYWDCECDIAYIHPISEPYCGRCDAHATDRPRSYITEVVENNHPWSG